MDYKGQISVGFKKLSKDVVTPKYANPGDAGLDLTAISVEYDRSIDCYIYHTGIAVAIPEGYVGLVFPRSSNRKTDAYMTNHVGVIDSGYRGEILVCYKNRISSIIKRNVARVVRHIFDNKFKVLDDIMYAPYQKGDRIAQLMIMPYPYVYLVEQQELSRTIRGEKGHGSSGN